MINTEIKKLNWVIDMKIIKGTSYKLEAHKHRELFEILKRLTPKRAWLNLFFFL